jgi:large subunit ribosomal protein L23
MVMKSIRKFNFNKNAGKLLDTSKSPENWKYGERIWFPNIPLTAVNVKKNSPALGFRTQPNVTKFEIGQMVERMYGIPVKKVNTINYEARKGRSQYYGIPRIIRSGFKKAYVYVADESVNRFYNNMQANREEIQRGEEEEEEQNINEEVEIENKEQETTKEITTNNPEPKEN